MTDGGQDVHANMEVTSTALTSLLLDRYPITNGKNARRWTRTLGVTEGTCGLMS